MTTATDSAGGSLNRQVGLLGLTFISLGSIIGSGWLLGALTAAKAAGPASLVSWLLAAAIIVVLALVHAELGATYPVSGGTARFPHLVFGPFGGFTAGWMAWLGSVTIAPIEVEAALQYLGNKWSGLAHVVKGTPVLTGTGLALAAVMMLSFTVVNILGVRWLAQTNKWAVWWKLTVPLVTIVVLMISSFHLSNFHAGGFAPFGVKGVLVCAIPCRSARQGLTRRPLDRLFFGHDAAAGHRRRPGARWGHEVVEQTAGGGGDLVDGAVEGLLVRL
jgi:amino acid transporter